MTVEIVQIRLEDKTDIIQSLVNVIKDKLKHNIL